MVGFMFNAVQEQLTDKEEAQMRDALADDFLSKGNFELPCQFSIQHCIP